VGNYSRISRQKLISRQTRFASLLLAILASILASHARADSFCGAGRHVGAENDGAGKSWLCVPDAPRAVRTGPAVSGGNEAAIGLGAGAAALDLFSALATILDRPPPGPTEQDLYLQEYTRQLGQKSAEVRARDKEEGAALAAEAFDAAKSGRYDIARDAFQKAYERSDEYEYRRDMIAMDALIKLKTAIKWASNGNKVAAYTEFRKAAALAKDAERPDISQSIENYRTELLALIDDDLAHDAKGARDASKKLSTTCMQVNGDFLCD